MNKKSRISPQNRLLELLNVSHYYFNYNYNLWRNGTFPFSLNQLWPNWRSTFCWRNPEMWESPNLGKCLNDSSLCWQNGLTVVEFLKKFLSLWSSFGPTVQCPLLPLLNFKGLISHPFLPSFLPSHHRLQKQSLWMENGRSISSYDEDLSSKT